MAVSEGAGRVDDESLKSMERGRNMTHMGLLAVKLGETNVQLTPSRPPETIKEYKMLDFWPTGGRYKVL